MRLLALKYNDLKAPDEGTIFHHQQMIEDNGFVWYGKFGTTTNKEIIKEILESDSPKILLLNNKQTKVHWAYISDITQNSIDVEYVPEYYRHDTDQVKTWFKVKKFEEVSPDILNDFVVCSSKKKLGTSAARGMASSYIIEPVDKETIDDEKS